MKNQDGPEDVTNGGIFSPSSKTQKKTKKQVFLAPDCTHMCLAHRVGHMAPRNTAHKLLAHECRRLEPETPLTCA